MWCAGRMNNEKFCRMQWHDWHLIPPLAVTVFCTAQRRLLACKMTQLQLLRGHLHIWECYPLLFYTLLLFLDSAHFLTPFLDHPSVFSYILAFFFTPSFFLCSPLLSFLRSRDVRPSIRFCNCQCTYLDSTLESFWYSDWSMHLSLFLSMLKANVCVSLCEGNLSQVGCVCVEKHG